MDQIHDLRSFMAALEARGLLFTAKKEVDWDHEIGSLIATLEPSGRAGWFPQVKGKPFGVCGNMLGSMDSIAVALGCEKSEITDFLADRLEHPIQPRLVRREEAPCQENVLLGDDVDLAKLPVPIHAPKDGGPIITGGVIVSKELDGPKQNLSFQRMHVKGKNKLSIMINEWRHLKEFYDAAEAQGKALPIAVAIGADPVVYVGGGLRYDGDEMEIAGAIRGRPMDVVKCVTNDIHVPAEAEFIIEGEILPGQRELEGPLGEFTGHYSAPWNSPVIHVTAITHRNGAIYQTINGASFEHINLGNVLPREPLLKKFTTYVSTGVINVHIPPYGSGFLALVRIRKKNPGEPKNVALAAMMTYVNIKNVIVVDEDVDIYDPADVMWALSNRVVPEKDIFYVPNAQGHELDPCSDERGVQTKMGIDATLSDESRCLERVRYPKVDLNDYQ
ncbi:UbiD family decarboxylase [Pseudoflavonifractor sp. MSJ-37]|uniref:UbiD family decarboxylase n=1 Tax=Pseudoflavonifractor sp. MSJ-37 TaxID=2841531 RepID=UPI001C0F9B63|nr:UbiD family decarboxylase [Pseudoflavonifractor sp. MSJ-37]MBU5435272.1 UbiD family decarboxylase [Pseudoflavonifractor sp. MSJ-37]